MNTSERYHSGFTEAQRLELKNAPRRRFVPAPFANKPGSVLFNIRFRTSLFVPNHVVTLRTSVDGWGRDLHGGFHGGAWHFGLPADLYPLPFECKFVLNKRTWMNGGNLRIQSTTDVEFNDTQVGFSDAEPRVRHPYDGLRVEEDALQQMLVRSCHREDRRFDVIVIGSGMGGGVFADALTDQNPALETLILDIGSLDFPTHIYNLPGNAPELDGRHQVRGWTKPQGSTSGFDGGVHMNLGGRSVFWGGMIPQMKDWELKHWPDSIARYLREGGYSAAEQLMRKHVTLGKYQDELITALTNEFGNDFEIVNAPRSYHQPECVASPGRPESFVSLSTGTFSTAELLVDSMSTSGKGGGGALRVNLNHRVTDLVRNGDRIDAVICDDLAGNVRRTYRAKRFVLAAGSMESVRIALQSGLDRDHPLIGAGYTDHPAYFLGYDDSKPLAMPETSKWFGAGRHARVFFYPKKTGYGGRFFNVEVIVNNQYWRERHTDDDILADRLQILPTKVNLKFSFDAALNESNFVRLDKSDGGDGRDRKLVVQVARVVEDLGARNAIEELAGKLLRFFGISPGNVWSFGGWGADGTPHHAGGSLRLGPTGSTADCVVDENLRFLELANLYACDVSVFPRIPAANPSLTLAALALRLADHLASNPP